jgi:hypothetical protein
MQRAVRTGLFRVGLTLQEQRKIVFSNRDHRLVAAIIDQVFENL